MSNPYPPPPPAGPVPPPPAADVPAVVVPVPGAPAAPAVPTADVTAAPGAWWSLLRALAAGDLAGATGVAVGPTGRVAGSRWVGPFAAVVNGLVVAVTMVLLMARLASELPYWFEPSAGDYLTALVLPVLCSLLLHVARAGSLAVLFRLRGRTIAFADAGALAGIPFVASTPYLVLALLLSVVPGTFAAVVLLVAGVFTTFYAEISLYVATARVGRFDRSPALPYAVASTAWLCVAGVVTWLIVQDVTAGIVDALGGVL